MEKRTDRVRTLFADPPPPEYKERRLRLETPAPGGVWLYSALLAAAATGLLVATARGLLALAADLGLLP